jgi:hypothetical protein
VYEVLIGTAATSAGIVLGALLERWRDDTRWKREEQMRWTTDLRVLYRDLLASGDEFFRRLSHSRMLEGRMKTERDISEPESHRLVRLLTDSFDVMERESQKVSAIAAEVGLIGSTEESGAVAAFAIEVIGGTLVSSDGELRLAEATYAEARKAVVEVARRSLRRV